jgi:uncharacterized protein (DUF488 family)
MYDTEGKIVECSESKKDEIMKKIVADTFAKKAYRTLLIAYADYSTEEYEKMKHANNGFVGEADREVLEQN